MTDQETAQRDAARELREALSMVNDRAAHAIRLGLHVEYKTTSFKEVGKPDGEFLAVKIRKDVV